MMTDEALILIVDDNDAARYLKTRTLRNAGFRTVETAFGEEAVALAHSDAPDLVLLDIKLPDIDGFEVCRRLRADSATASMAIVQISATFEAPEHRVRGLEGGADTFLVAPVEPTVLVATVRAMLRLRRAEARLREFDRRKDEFMATLAHELRNPLAPLLYCLDSLQAQAEDSEPLQATVMMMRRQTDHLIRLVDDLVDMSRITQNKLTLQLAPIELREIVQIAVEARRSELELKGQSLTLELPDAPVRLYADGVRLAQVFGNLISNSIKYTNRGGRIHIEAKLEPDAVSVAVADSGIGISAEDLDRVFELFVQLRQRSSGLGIGLALVTRIVQMHGGTVTAASEGRGRGSTFTVRLPLAPPDIADQKKTSAETPRLERRKVLVVDDNADAVDSLAGLLRGMGQEVRTSYGGRQAVEVAESFRPDLIFMDISMPDLGGIECIEHIRRQPWATSTTICALTGHGQSADRERSARAGADLHLVKPVGRAVIADVLEGLAEP